MRTNKRMGNIDEGFGGDDCGDGICTSGVEGCDSCPEDCPCTDSGLCIGDECIEF